MNEKSFKIFVDFDGTIVKPDCGASVVYQFGNPEKLDEIIQDWVEEKITSPESWFRMFASMRSFTNEELENLLATIKLDETFPSFVEYCRNNNFELRILSDGFDFYIDRIFSRENLIDLEVYCNKAKLDESNHITPEFPFGDEECKQCGCCKRNQILVNTGDNDYVVYIGDGYSDKCPVQFCDFIFAKDDLLKYCEKNRITYFPFNSFGDVIKKLDELKSKKRLKKRYQAELKRKEIFMQG